MVLVGSACPRSNVAVEAALVRFAYALATNLGQLWTFQGGHDHRHISHIKAILAEIRTGL